MSRPPSRRKSPRTSRRISRRKSPRTSRRLSRRKSPRTSRRTSKTYRSTPPAIPRERERHGTVENSITFTIGDDNTLEIVREDPFQTTNARDDIVDLVTDQLDTTIAGYDDEEVPSKISIQELFASVNAILNPHKDKFSLLEEDERGSVHAEAEHEWKKFRAKVDGDTLIVTYSDSGNMGSLEQQMEAAAQQMANAAIEPGA